MVYLILAILATITINAMIKVYKVRGANRQVVLASNYVIASLLGWAFALARGIDGISQRRRCNAYGNNDLVRTLARRAYPQDARSCAAGLLGHG
ncbi:MAG: hypothetical protein JXA89_00980 [Anaerolineae bacterium]|nr:hypothetical protein [Anaerolineae bacterium]